MVQTQFLFQQVPLYKSEISTCILVFLVLNQKYQTRRWLLNAQWMVTSHWKCLQTAKVSEDTDLHLLSFVKKNSILVLHVGLHIFSPFQV